MSSDSTDGAGVGALVRLVNARMVNTDSGTVYVSVSDTGRGISPEAKALILERLYQYPDSVDTSNRSGLGLDLFICKELIHLQNGRIWVTSELGSGSLFTFTLPIYSLAKLLAPVIMHKDQLRSSFVLSRVELTSRSNPPLGKWREIWQHCLETLRRCVYLDKDLVLPPMGSSGQAETFFAVASTDVEHVEIMTTRIREQLERIPDLKAKATLSITTAPVDILHDDASDSLEKQVQSVADRVTGMIMLGMSEKEMHAGNKEPRNSN